MRRPAFIPCLLLTVCCVFVALSRSFAVIPEFTWTGHGSSDNWFDAGNWEGGSVPDDGAVVVFGSATRTRVTYSSYPYEVFVHGIKFWNITSPYEIYGTYDTTNIGAGGILYAPVAPIISEFRDAVNLTASQVWNVASGVLKVHGEISDLAFDNELQAYVSGNYTIEKTGAGTLALLRASSEDWSGGLKLTAGRVVATGEYDFETYSLGTGKLTFNGGTLVAKGEYHDDDFVVLGNQIESNGLISTENINDLELHGDVTLNADTTIKTIGKPLYFHGTISDNEGEKSLTLDSTGIVVLYGSSGWTGGTNVNRGVLIFAGEDNTPGIEGAITIGAQGYAGMTIDQNMGLFLSEIAKTSTGTIGFDTDPSSPPSTFSGEIDLTGFNANVRLGSATSAILTGPITPPEGGDYRFGGGGGVLTVQSELSGQRAVIADSPIEAPLTLHIRNGVESTNSFTGGVQATNSAIIFEDGALPDGNVLTLNSGGYIGIKDAYENPLQFFSMFAPGTNKGMIGFDSTEGVSVYENIDLSTYEPGVYLGTASHAYLGGSIAPAGDKVIRLGAYKGGHLEVGGTLSGTDTKVYIGDPTSPATFGDFREEQFSTVYLYGDNSYGGGTTLFAGHLVVGEAEVEGLQTESLFNLSPTPTTVLGTGALIVQPVQFNSPLHLGETFMPVLSTAYTGIVIGNDVQLNGDLAIGEESAVTLTGTVSGPGELYLEEYSRLALSNDNNSFTGGIYVGYGSELTLLGDHAAGKGTLSFGRTNSNVYFETANPIVYGLDSQNEDYSHLRFEQSSTTLTVNQTADGAFNGAIIATLASEPAVDGLARFVKTGEGTLRLNDGYFSFAGGTPQQNMPSIAIEVQQGNLYIGSDFDPSSANGATWINGGRATFHNNYVSNEIIVSSGGTLAGDGAFLSNVSINSGAILSPGLGGPAANLGTLMISHLTLAGGGIYEWHIQNPDIEAQDHDLIRVTTPLTLEIAATSEDPFIIRPVTLNSDGFNGIMNGIEPGVTYAWTLIDYEAVANGDLSRFVLDTSLFQTGFEGTFALSFVAEDESSGQLMLNFTAIPEPSTYALLGLGLGFVAFASWRSRKLRR